MPIVRFDARVGSCDGANTLPSLLPTSVVAEVPPPQAYSTKAMRVPPVRNHN